MPAYGTTIGPDGHLVTNDDWQLFDGQRVAATENECYNACGFHSEDPHWAVMMSNLKALQLRMNWIYVVPRPSYMRELPEHWDWVRLEVGHTAETAPDAWVALRDAVDNYWKSAHPDERFTGFPYVRNLERWIIQRDVPGDGVPRRGSLVHQGDPHPWNGKSFESLRTDGASGNTRLYFDVDEDFLGPGAAQPVELKVTWRDFVGRSWRVSYRDASGVVRTSPAVTGTGTGALRTTTIAIDDAAFDDGLASSTDFYLEAVEGDLEASFVRLIKVP